MTSGDLQLAAPQSVELPPVPADLKVCFGRGVAQPKPGAMSKRDLYRLIAELKGSDDAKSDCGVRLVAWFEDIARGLAAAPKKGG